MFFLLRAAFWLCVVVMLLPGDPERGIDAPRVTLFEALGAAQATVTDIAHFCDRNPAVCTTGGNVVQVMGDKASYNARQLQEYLTREGESEGTLTPEDTAAPWVEPHDNAV